MGLHYNKETDKRKREEQIRKKTQINSIKKLIKEEKLSRALAEVNRYLEKYPNDPYGLFQEASIYFRINLEDEAEDIFKELIEIESECKYSSLYKLGTIEFNRGNEEKAQQYFTRCIEESPYPEFFSRKELCLILGKKEQFNEAYDILAECFNQLDELSGDENKYLLEMMKLTLVKLKMMEFMHKEAEKILDSIKEDEVIDKMQFWSLKDEILQYLGNYSESHHYIEKLLSGPKNRYYWQAKVSKASIRIRDHQYEKAISICQEVMKNCEFEEIKQYAKMTLARVYVESGNYDIAQDIYLTVEKENTVGYASLAKMEYRRKNYQKALEYYELVEGKVTKKNFQHNLVIKIWCYIKLGKYQEAYGLSKKLNQKYIVDAKIRYELHLSLLYLDQMLGKIPSQPNSYIEDQTALYNQDEMVKHIQQTLMKGESEFVFYDEVDLRQLSIEVEEIIRKEEPETNFFVETYIIPYEGLGMDKAGRENKTLKVVKIPNGIISMWPSMEKSRKQSIAQTKSNQKTKQRKGQIEKFNEKYLRVNNV